MSDFVVALHDEGLLSPAESAILTAAGIQDGEGLYALTLNFPSLAELVDLRQLSTVGMMRSDRGYAAAAQAMSRLDPPTYAMGAIKPPRVRHPPRSIPVPAPGSIRAASARRGATGSGGSGGSGTFSMPIDLHVASWDVRDQGSRGTCVAHAMAACREHLAFQNGAAPGSVDQSEQFLFWAAKTQGGDPSGDDGTMFEFAQAALNVEGVCEEAHWRYDGTAIVGDVTHAATTGMPTDPIRAHAKTYKHAARHYQAGGKAADVLHQLRTGHAVGLSVPVYADPLVLSRNNWNTSVARQYGVVIDPPAVSVPVNAHAVCLVGYAPDSNAPGGGWFIFRNSWGSDWASRAPSPRRYAPQPGYGQISVAYVDDFTWEICSL
jgi:C1A family cysteine protease